MITEIKPDDVLVGCRRTLGLSENHRELLDEVLLAALLRHSAGIHCPCSRTTLRASLLESLTYLSEDKQTLSERIDTIIEGLIVGGDLLELSDVATDDPEIKGTWVFAAPPSFVVRPSGSIFLLGIVPDQDTFLPQALTARISHEGFTRVIIQEPGEDLAADLREHGMQELSESTWLKCPRAERPEAMLAQYKRELSLQPPSGAIEDLHILDPTKPVAYYRGRWTTPRSQTGTFIARRPQEFGAPLWCFAKLEAGSAVQILDLPLRKTRWRGCDVAWHLQMAIDFCRQTPQHYRRQDVGNEGRIDFFSPLPQWAQRRLMILGHPCRPEQSLMSYLLPSAEAKDEEQFLREQLWLSPTK